MHENSLNLNTALQSWWRRKRKEAGVLSALRQLIEITLEFVRDSFPDRRRQRYGDADYDWQYRVNTTGATVSWRSRLIGLMNSPYQPIPAEQFREMMSALNIEFKQFTFIDIGSGKGRALLLAREYGFRRIIGVELLPELDHVARQNVSKFAENGTGCSIDLVCVDATSFVFPAEPTVVFLFNPLPESGLACLAGNIQRSLRENPRPFYVAYANPVLEQTLTERLRLTKLSGTAQYSLFCRSGSCESDGVESSD